jgi:hypothetical protein
MNVGEQIAVIRTLAYVNSNEPPASKKQVRRLNIMMSDLLGNQNRSGKLSVVSFIVGRNIKSTKDLNRYEAKMLIEEQGLSEIVEYALQNTRTD